MLRFNLQWQSGYDTVIWGGLGLLLLLQAVLVWNLGLHRSMWRFVGLHELVRVGGAVVFTGLLLALVALALPQGFGIPRSIVLLYPLLLLFFMGGGRVAWRLWREYRLYHSPAARRGLQHRSLPVVVVGAGAAGAWLLRDLTRQKRWRVVGLVDDDPSKHGLKVSGVRVHGSLSSLPSLMATFRAKHVVVAIPTAQREVLRRVSSLLDEADFQLLTIPGISELMSGRVSIDALRPVAIEDLLGRDAVSIDSDEVGQMIVNQRVLVTGAGGSIGSELCRQVAVFKPAKLILFDHSEYALYAIAQWFADHAPTVKVVALTGDVKDEVRVDEVFASYKPSLVLHAAAYKHVPLMEQNNAWQAVRNNVFGTLNVARAAKRYGSKRFVLVSTDKAVNPANVMGATKRLAEMLCEGLNNNSATRFMIVRFGNVLGSAGSVIPRFRQQIESGGPVTVTHPEITRYFMLTTEAAQLVLQATTMGDGGEVFVLDMGEPVRIVDLARKMIQLSGVSEDQIPLRFSG
ncbi:MAG TPA: nucleoside-diphosphate sugar epimerase/dehydratase, partial [Burkholderiaceae bacterium]|nr:nucleoside-diphosphate sugar epimerase/dehydratase [Burkholderiaceae bacterium]